MEDPLGWAAIAALQLNLSVGAWLLIIVLTLYLLRSLWKRIEILAKTGAGTNPWYLTMRYG